MSILLNKAGAWLRNAGKSAAVLLFYTVLPLGLPAFVFERTGSWKLASLAFLFAMLGYAMVRIYQARDIVMMNLRMVETQMFGKPLDRENWGAGELRKVKPFGWSGKDERT